MANRPTWASCHALLQSKAMNTNDQPIRSQFRFSRLTFLDMAAGVLICSACFYAGYQLALSHVEQAEFRTWMDKQWDQIDARNQ